MVFDNAVFPTTKKEEKEKEVVSLLNNGGKAKFKFSESEGSNVYEFEIDLTRYTELKKSNPL